MQMDKRRLAALCIAALLFLPSRAAALEPCQITATSLKTLPGKTVTVPVSITGNPGFTNFAIALEYDADILELAGIRPAAEEPAFLFSTNTAWKTPEGKTCGYITAASGEKITGDGELLTAIFTVKSGVKGAATVTPIVRYLHNYEEALPDIDVLVQAADIAVIACGDINMDGVIEYDDVILAYQAANGEITLTAQQVEIADLAENTGVVDMDDVRAIYDIYTGGE